MSFWQLSDGEDAAAGGKEFEIEGGGKMLPIPDESQVMAMVDEAAWKTTNNGDLYVALRWNILAPDQYKNRKIFHKLWVTDADPSAKDEDAAKKKRDKARRMLAAIDANAGGRLTKKAGTPTDDDLAASLCGKPMIIGLKVWSMPDRENPGEKIEGNWVYRVADKSAGVSVAAQVAQKPKPAPAALDDDDEDSIPF